MKHDTIIALVDQLESSGLTDHQSKIVEQILAFCASEQTKSTAALNRSVALNELLLRRPTIH